MNNRMKKALSLIASLKVAIALLLLITLYIIIGTLIPQHATEALYQSNFPTLAPIIDALSLDAAYSSPLFITLIILFIMNLTSCTILSLPSQLRRSRSTYMPSFKTESEYSVEEEDEKLVMAYLKRKHYRITADENGFSSGRFRWGALGATVTHIGLIVIFIGAIVGNITSDQEMISLLPGSTREFEKYGFSIHLDDFYLTFEEGGAVKQYISDLTITNDDGTTRKQSMWVNNPLHHNGLGFYQANFGWTSDLLIRQAETGEELVSGLIRNGNTYFYQPHHLNIMLYGYFPNMEIDSNQMPYSINNREDNPFYAVVLTQFGVNVGSYIIEPGQVIPYEDIAITFTGSTPYTGIVVRSDPSYPIVVAGFIILTFGMFMSFYLYPRFLFYTNGKLYAVSGKNGWVFFQAIKSGITAQRKTGKQ